jgi:tetratricopeptide (TPR) repeat protein
MLRSSLAISVALFIVSQALAQPTPSPTPDPRSRAEIIGDKALGQVAAWKLKGAAQTLDETRENLGTSSEHRIASAALKIAEGAYDDALRMLDAVAKDHPKDPVPDYLRGDSLAYRGKFSDGKPAWQKARTKAQALVAADPKDGRAQFWLAAAQIRLQEYDAALQSLAKAGEAGFDPMLVDYQRGLAFVMKRDYQKAVDAFSAVEARDNAYAHVFFYRGLAWSQLGKKDKMLVDMDRFLKLAPNAPEASQAQAFLAAYQ